MKKRGDTSIWIIITLILGITILVLFLTGIIDIWPDNLFKKSSNVDLIATQCSVLCSTNSKYNFCSQEREVVFSAEKTEKSTCFQFAKKYPDYFKSCSSISCTGSTTPPVVTPPEELPTNGVRTLEEIENAIIYARDHDIPRDVVKTAKRCSCGDDKTCKDYAQILYESSLIRDGKSDNNPLEDPLDPLFVLAVWMQESSCTKNAISSTSATYPSIGISQINIRYWCGSSDAKNIGITYLSSDKATCKSELYDVETNTKAAIEILKFNYRTIPKQFTGACFSEQKQKYFSKWDAALRGYNGWGCPLEDRSQCTISENKNSCIGHDYYVEIVNSIYEILKQHTS